MVTPKEARELLENEHQISIQSATVLKWLNLGYLEGEKIGGRWYTTIESIENALVDGKIPPRVGRKRRFTKEQRKQMRDMAEKHTLKEVAKHFGCDQSYISLIKRGLR